MMKRMVLRVMTAVLTWVLLVVPGYSIAGDHISAVTSDVALKKLMDGNKRYVENKLSSASSCDPAVRTVLARSQNPYAVIVTCSDSRLAPEIIFDKGLGEIFVIRVAGNIPDAIVLGSIEYAVEHLGSPLVMVLGHERCGAVTAAVNAGGRTTGSPNIDAIVKTIEPSIKATMADFKSQKGKNKNLTSKGDAFVECVIDTNTLTVAAEIIKGSKIIKELADEKKIKIVAAKYDLDNGLVTLY